jgi:hypothetical protein
MAIQVVIVSIVSDDISEALEVASGITALLGVSPDIEIEESGRGGVAVHAAYEGVKEYSGGFND